MSTDPFSAGYRGAIDAPEPSVGDYRLDPPDLGENPCPDGPDADTACGECEECLDYETHMRTIREDCDVYDKRDLNDRCGKCRRCENEAEMEAERYWSNRDRIVWDTRTEEQV